MIVAIVTQTGTNAISGSHIGVNLYKKNLKNTQMKSILPQCPSRTKYYGANRIII